MKFLVTDIEGQVSQCFDCVDLDDAIGQAEDWLTEQGLYKDDCEMQTPCAHCRHRKRCLA